MFDESNQLAIDFEPLNTQSAPTMNPQERFDWLRQRIEAKEIIGFRTKTTRYRLFISTDEHLCFFKGKSRTRGYQLQPQQCKGFVDVLTVPPKAGENYLTVAKYRRYALKAQHTNAFIEACRNVPSTREEWEQGGCKSAYELDLTTGTGIDGKVISLSSIVKQYPYEVQWFKHYWNAKQAHHSGRFRFRGYDASFEIWETGGKGSGLWSACLSLEYKDCGNGYYYLLINDEHFIGYDID